MAYSDDETQAEASSLCVSDYHLEDNDDMPVSFSVLPIQWSDSEDTDACKEKVFLHGSADNGLQKILFQVNAWRFDFSHVKPAISLLSKDRMWIRLQKPRKSFQDTIRTILVTIHFLHHLKKNPKISSKCVWDNLCKDKDLSSYKLKPSQNDLLNHMPLIGEAAKRDAALAKSKLLLTILEENTGNKKLADEEVKDLERPGFIVDDIDNDMIYEANEESEAEDDLFCSVCALCDNGGKLTCCEGACMRSFHATKEDGGDICDSLGLAQKEVDKAKIFYCKNCQYNQHQCFACGKLGSSGQAKGAEVIKCACATCDHFYHPHCVAKLLPQVVKHVAEELERNIADGDRFTCPVHYCCVCKESENKTDPELRFAVCRRCPKSYHRKCLPREIAFENPDDEDIIPRAWEGLLPNNRILIYCFNHEIDDELGTPIRDHIKFPSFKATAREINTNKEKMKPANKERVISNKNNVDLDNSSDKITAKGSKVTGKLSSEKVGSKRKSENINSGSNILKKPKAKETSRRRSFENKRSISKKFEMPGCEENQPLCALKNKASVRIKPDNQVKPTRKLSSASPPLDADSERSLSALFKEARSSIMLDSVLEKKQIASTHAHSLRKVVEEAITTGKLEGSVDAVRTALRKLEDGCSIKDVEAVCNRDVLKQIFKWKIVDKLHWYVQDGDTIVDFCCGANDFSILMKKKLEETGKKCSYKNYDLLPTKNDFSFEMRDWMAVDPNELPTGSQLIMGLNPPFGAKATLANKFIDKALEFKPKLLILIVPQETERLDKKRSSYDLVWEDENFLSGKSFYLPGSVDVNDKQIEQWNVRPPLLSLWSRRDWTTQHKVIAQEHGHMSCQHDTEMLSADHTRDGNDGDNLMLSHDLLKSTDDQEDQASMSKSRKSSCKRKHIEENDKPAKRQAVNEMIEELPDHSQPNPIDRKFSIEGFQLTPVMVCPTVEVGDNGYGHLEPVSDSGTTNSREKEKHQRESDVRQVDSATESSYRMNTTPAMVDELNQNHVRMGSLGSEPPTVSRSGTFERSVPQPGYGDGLLGFASGPHYAFSLQNSAGWLDE